MILSALALLQKNAQPSRQEIIDAMDGNICRCGVYGRIVQAIELASQRIKGGSR